MRTLIAEDDFISRKFLFKFLSQFGECDVTVNGMEAIEVYLMGLDANDPYDLVCLDIMMPDIDGLHVRKAIREIERKRKLPEKDHVKIIMTTALNQEETVKASFDGPLEGFAGKPIDTDHLLEVIKRLGLDVSS